MAKSLAKLLVLVTPKRRWAQFRLGTLLLVVTALCLSLGWSVNEELRAYFWFSSLGFPDVKKAGLVRVSTGHWSRRGSDPPENEFIYGFLLADRGDEFTVLKLSLEQESFTKTADANPAHERVAYAHQDLKSEVAKLLARADEAGAGDESDLSYQLGTHSYRRMEVFFLAWACWRHGLRRDANGLYNHAVTLVDTDPDGRATTSLRLAVANDIAGSEICEIDAGFAEASISRAELLTRYFDFLERHPGTAPFDRAAETAALLKSMVQEDAEHAKKLKKRRPFEELDLNDQIAELIFELRDQNGQQLVLPGGPSVFNDPRDERSPAHQLLNAGYEAIPQLIEAIGDRRFTRTVGLDRDHSHYMLRVGDCAREIIRRIAGLKFQRAARSISVVDDDVTVFSADVQAWFADFKKKGE
jgi:hypothetical protein